MRNLTPLEPEDHQRLQAELTSGESILWAGKPNPSVIFHPHDWYSIPFSLFWCAFTVFWEWGALKHPHSLADIHLDFFALWGIPFILAGQYFLWFRFVYAAWKKRQILYAVTSKRVLSLTSRRTGSVIASYIDTLPSIDKKLRSDGIGTVIFGQFPTTKTGNSYGEGRNMDALYLSAGIPVFADIDEAQTVYALVTDLRARATRP